MPTDVIMPQMGESIFEGTITKWLKKPGDKVQRDEPLFEISTDKVDAEIPAPVSGVLQEIKVTEGTTVQVNTIVGTISDGDSSAAAKAAPSAPAAAEKKEASKPAQMAQAPPPMPAPEVHHEAETHDEDVRSSPLVRKIARDAKKDNYTFAALVEGIVNSDAFRKQGLPLKSAPKTTSQTKVETTPDKLPVASSIKAAELPSLSNRVGQSKQGQTQSGQAK